MRCPSCKSTRWNKPEIRDKCLRCGAEWVQRSDNPPKYCPACHSSMWNRERKVFTCSKCGRTRILRSNSRGGMCPICDRYALMHPRPIFGRTGLSLDRSTRIGIGRSVRIWSSGDGLIINYVDNGRDYAYAYRDGKLIGSVKLDSWCRKEMVDMGRLTSGRPGPYEEHALSLLAESMEARSRSDISSVPWSKGSESLRERVLSLSGEGMEPLPIALKLGITFSEVMDILNSPPERAETGNAGGNGAGPADNARV